MQSADMHADGKSDLLSIHAFSDRMAYCLKLDLELAQVARSEGALDIRRARCIRAVDRDRTWRDLGYPSILAYLEVRLGIGPRTASDRLRVARSLAELPEIERAVESGEISRSIARELCRVADAKTEGAWLERARGKCQRDVEEMVKGRCKGSDPDDAPDPDLQKHRITIEVTAATFALYRQTLSTLADEAGRHVDQDEALATMCRRTLEPSTEEAPTKAAHQVAVTVCRDCQRGWQDGGGAVVELERAEVEVALCDAEHVGSVLDEHPDRAHQDVTPAMRRLVWRRDHGRCRVEGCRSSRNLDVHHVVHRADGGGHEASNLVVMCSGCHAALHRGLITVEGVAPQYKFHHRFGAAKPASDSAVAALSAGAAQDREPRTEVLKSSPGHAEGRHRPSPATTRPRADGLDNAAADLRRQARDCLTASGYSKSEAASAIDAAVAGRAFTSLEELLREALRRCLAERRH